MDNMVKFIKRMFYKVEPVNNHKCGKIYLIYDGWKFCPYCGCKL